MRKLITAALLAASQVFPSLAIADNGQTNPPETSVQTARGLEDGRYILLNAPTMCEQQLVYVKDGKIALQANSFQLPRGEYQFLGENDAPRSATFSIEGGKESHKWFISLHRVDKKSAKWPTGLRLDGIDLSEGEYLYKCRSDLNAPGPRPPLKLKISGDGHLRWTNAFLLAGRYLYIGDGHPGNMKEALSIRPISERLYEVTKGGRSKTLVLDEQGQTKWQVGKLPEVRL